MLAPQNKLWPASSKVASSALSLLQVSSSDIICDFGSGSGIALKLAVEDFNAQRAIGYEIHAERAEESRKMIADAFLSDRITVYTMNALDADVERDRITCVYVYLVARGLALLKPILQKLASRLPNGQALRVVSVLYKIPGWIPIKSERCYTSDAIYSPLYLYEVRAD